MESRQEIESMRVSDLRAFLKRHGHVPAVVTRADGTPGAPRKADLQRAALAIEAAARAARPPDALAADPALAAYSPPRPHNRRHTPNPFQTRIASPADTQTAQRSMSTPAGTQHPAVADVTTAPQPLPVETAKTPERRKRRASAAWIDPSLLTGLTPTGKPRPATNPKAKTRPLTPARPVPPPVVGEDDQPILIEDDSPPPPPPPARPRRRTSTRHAQPTQTAGSLRDAELPDDDDDDDDFNAADPRLADSFEDLDEFADELVDENELFDDTALDEDRRDLLVHSDYEGAPDREDEPDSTVETDEEIVADSFQSWDVLRLRRWLDAHHVRYARNSRKSELISLARAHSLQMETAIENPDPEEEDAIRPARRAGATRAQSRTTRRRRIITAPVDEDEPGEVPFDVDQFAAASTTTNHRATKRRGKGRPAADNEFEARPRVRFSTTYFVALVTVVLGTVCMWSAFTVYRSHSRPFCDTDDLTNIIAGGEECRRCPHFGKCFNGTLTCDAGYVSLGGKVCVEDQESSIFGEELANDAYSLLSHQAGRAECGEIESGSLSLADLKKALKIKHSEKPEKGFFQWNIREFDRQKFDFAFEKAVKRLKDDDFHDVSISAFDEYISNTPVMSFPCTVKLALRRNWRIVGIFIGACALFVYIKIFLYLRKLQQDELENAYRTALEYLREQKGGYVRSEEEFAFISDVVLRQEVLGTPTEKVVKLWKKVEELLKNDSRVAWNANKIVKGVPSNTFEWRSRVSKGGVFASGGSLRSLDSPAVSDGPMPSAPETSWLDNARRRLFKPQ